MDDKLYKIGDIANIFHISVQTLRHYEKEGLLQPSVINQSSGYRYYSFTQFETIRQIMFLKRIGFSLKDIKKQISKQSNADYIKTLQNYSEILEARIAADTRTKHIVDSRLDFIQKSITMPKDCTLFSYFPEEIILKHIGRVSNSNEIEITLHDIVSKYNLDSSISIVGQIFDPNALTFNGSISASGIYLLEEMVPAKLDRGNMDIIPEGLYAVMYYDKPSELSLPVMQKLLSDISKAGFRAVGDIYRTIILDVVNRENDNMYLARIRIKVEQV